MTRAPIIIKIIPVLHPNKQIAYGKFRRDGDTIDVVKWYPQCSHVPVVP